MFLKIYDRFKVDIPFIVYVNSINCFISTVPKFVKNKTFSLDTYTMM